MKEEDKNKEKLPKYVKASELEKYMESDEWKNFVKEHEKRLIHQILTKNVSVGEY